MLISVNDGVENIVGKGENVGCKHFSFSHNASKTSVSVSFKNSGLCGNYLNCPMESQKTPFKNTVVERENA